MAPGRRAHESTRCRSIFCCSSEVSAKSATAPTAIRASTTVSAGGGDAGGEVGGGGGGGVGGGEGGKDGGGMEGGGEVGSGMEGGGTVGGGEVGGGEVGGGEVGGGEVGGGEVGGEAGGGASARRVGRSRARAESTRPIDSLSTQLVRRAAAPDIDTPPSAPPHKYGGLGRLCSFLQQDRPDIILLLAVCQWVRSWREVRMDMHLLSLRAHALVDLPRMS